MYDAPVSDQAATMTDEPTDTRSTKPRPAMSADRLALGWLPGRYAVCRLAARAEMPEWATSGGGLVSITRTDDELSIVAPESAVPGEVAAQRGWRAMRVLGTLDFSMVGVLARLTGACAGADVPVFVVSTYDTDIVMVKAEDAGRAVEALAGVADVSRLR